MRWSLAVLLPLLSVGLAGPSPAQIVEIPTFDVARPTLEQYVGGADVALGADGNVLVAYTEWKSGSLNATKALTVVLAPDGAPLRAPVRVDTEAHVRFVNVAALTDGSYMAALEVGQDRHYLHGRRLASDGTGAGDELEIDDPNVFSWAMPTTVAAMSTGSAFLWEQGQAQLWGRLYDTTGIPRGGQFAISEQGGATGFDLDADAMPDGGFVVVWQSGYRENQTSARVYRADGQPRGPVLPVDAGILSDMRIAASPTGGFAVVGARWDGVDRFQLVVRRFTDDGVLLWESMVDAPPANVSERADLAFDVLGNVYVAWGSFGGDGSYVHHPHARGLDAGGTPLGGTIELDDFETTPELRVARLANGTSFATVWNWGGAHISGAIVALCGPGGTVCGDGAVAPHCEQCDDGPSNSDTTPDACRTDCRRAHCGDGTLDSGEECDDGNVLACDGCDPLCKLETGHLCGDGEVDPTCNEECDNGPANADTADACRTTCRLPRCGDGIKDSTEECDDGNFVGCDGCSPSCRIETGLVCGDGVAEAGCGETCDDGNLASRDGCSATCVAERIPGGGTAATDCYAEWSVRNVGNVPYLDKHGAISSVQVCTDNDPGCDGDGGTPGSCTFAVRVCGNDTELAGCVAPLRLRSWELRSPSASKAAHDPNAAAIRAAVATVPGTIVGPSTRDVCAEPASIPVRLRGSPGAYKATKLKLKARAGAYDGSVDNDTLTLICRPAP